MLTFVLKLKHATDATLSKGWGGVGWGGDVNVRFEVEHATDATLSKGWGWGC